MFTGPWAFEFYSTLFSPEAHRAKLRARLRHCPLSAKLEVEGPFYGPKERPALGSGGLSKTASGPELASEYFSTTHAHRS